MVRQMREMIRGGVIGGPKGRCTILPGLDQSSDSRQGKKKNGLETRSAKAGQSCCMGDIGVHAFNMAEYATGLKTASVLPNSKHFMMTTHWILMEPPCFDLMMAKA